MIRFLVMLLPQLLLRVVVVEVLALEGMVDLAAEALVALYSHQERQQQLALEILQTHHLAKVIMVAVVPESLVEQVALVVVGEVLMPLEGREQEAPGL